MTRTMAFMLAGAMAGAAIPHTAAAADDDLNRVIVLENLSSQAIHYFYASPVTSKDWEEDLLGERTVPAGESLQADIDNGTNECVYDLKVVLEDGKEHIQREVDVCVVSKWVVGETGDSIQ